MAKIVKVYKEEMPELLLIGKCYHGSDRDEHGTFAQKWEEWFSNGWFDEPKEPASDAYVGAMRMNEGVFEYWIGVMCKPSAAVPNGFCSVSLPKCSASVAYIKGKDDPELYSMHEECLKAFKNAGYDIPEDTWYIERYACPRFTEPDENGEVILDYIVYDK